MKKLIGLGVLLILLVGLVVGWGTIREVGAQIVESFSSDPDRGPFDTGMSKEEYLLKRRRGHRTEARAGQKRRTARSANSTERDQADGRTRTQGESSRFASVDRDRA